MQPNRPSKTNLQACFKLESGVPEVEKKKLKRNLQVKTGGTVRLADLQPEWSSWAKLQSVSKIKSLSSSGVGQ